jgi:predicted Zn-dependent protease
VQKLSANEAMRLPVQLGVISAGAGVASALPGGYALVSAGAIRDASTEAEAAALLAHAIGHVQAGTPVRVVNSVPIIFSGEFGACVREKKGTPSVLVPQYLLGTPDQEVQADLVALQLLNKAGYDPDALLTVFDRWGKRHAPAAEIRQQAAALRVGTQIVDSSEFERIRARLAPTARPSPTLRSLSRP